MQNRGKVGKRAAKLTAAVALSAALVSTSIPLAGMEVKAEDTSAEATAVRGNHPDYAAENVTDNDYDTYWTMDDGQTTGSVTVELDEPVWM